MPAAARSSPGPRWPGRQPPGPARWPQAPWWGYGPPPRQRSAAPTWRDWPPGYASRRLIPARQPAKSPGHSTLSRLLTWSSRGRSRGDARRPGYPSLDQLRQRTAAGPAGDRDPDRRSRGSSPAAHLRDDRTAQARPPRRVTAAHGGRAHRQPPRADAAGPRLLPAPALPCERASRRDTLHVRRRSSLVVDDRFHASRFWAAARDFRASWLNLVPAILGILGEVAPPDEAAARRVRFARSASAPLSRSVQDRSRTGRASACWKRTA